MRVLKRILLLVAAVWLLPACDKIDPPYKQEGIIDNGGITAPPGFYQGTIPGNITAYTVTDSWVDDSTEIRAFWTYDAGGAEASASVYFIWHGVTSATITSTALTGDPVSVDGDMEIAAGGFYGTLRFSYEATFDASGSGTGYTVNDVNIRRKVLLEDYTGHKCGNCPRATRAALDLKNLAGDGLVLLAVHAGFFATPNPITAPSFTYDFRTPAGTDLDTDFGISAAGNPNGMVNRKKINGSQILAYTSWGSEVNNILTSTDPLQTGIRIINDFNLTSGQLQTEVRIAHFTGLQGNYRLSVFLVEDQIINWQKDYDVTPSDIEFYVHRHVLRESFNNTYGDLLTNTSQGAITSMPYSIPVDSEYDAQHCSVIAFIFNETTKEIIQVEEVPLIP